MQVFESLERLFQQIERLFLLVAVLLLVVMLAANAANIASRNFFGAASIDVFPWTTVFFVWMSFLSFFVIYRRGRDIAVHFVIDRIGGRARVVGWIVARFVTLFVMVVIMVEAPGIIELQVGEVSDFVMIERFWLTFPFFVSCALILADVAVVLLRSAVSREIPLPSEPSH